MSKELFDKAAAQWDNKPLRLQLAEKVINAITAAIPLDQDMEAMEIGCGTGLITISLSPQLQRIVATDTSDGMLQVLRGKIADLATDNIEPLLLADDDSYAQLGENRFHLIYSSMTLHHIHDTVGMLRRCLALLRPGGFIAMADLEQEDGTFHSDMTGVEHLGFQPRQLTKEAEKIGFTAVTAPRIHVIRKQDEQGERHDYPIFLLCGKKPR